MTIDLGNRREINLYRLVYRSGINGRLSRPMWLKAPYGTMFVITELLTRQVTQGLIRWYRLSAMTHAEITEHRKELARPMEALRASSAITRIEWDA